MSVADSGPEAQQCSLVDNLALLQDSVIFALGDIGHPLDIDSLVATLPSYCQEIIHSYANNLEFPGKGRGRPLVAFVECFIANPHSMVSYEYGINPGYTLNQAGMMHYHEIIEQYERQEANIIPKAQPAANRVVRSMGGGALAAVWTG
ncbi:MAG: hypothetical protein ABIQ89_01035 [Candidatus Saccharimonadales bacterium]